MKMEGGSEGLHPALDGPVTAQSFPKECPQKPGTQSGSLQKAPGP